MQDHYKILGVQNDADSDTIKKAYRTMAKKYHPDKNSGDKNAEEMFKKISSAYDILGDENKKAKYDASKNPYQGFNFHTRDPFQNFNRRSSGNSAWDSHYNPGFDYNQAPKPKGTSLNITLTLSLEDILNGVSKKIKLKRDKTCTSCKGNGADQGISLQQCGTCNGIGYHNITQNRGFVTMNTVQLCGVCQGSGKVVLEICFPCVGRGVKQEEDVIDVSIPAGASEGVQFDIKGKGNESKGGGESGDLFIKIKESIPKEFIRRGIDLLSMKQITFIDAVLGTNIDVELPSGDVVKAVVDPGTVPGTVLKFNSKGIPNLGYGGIGDFLVELNVKIPSITNEEDKKILNELKEKEIFQ
jgi:molecular chaperone DnaJ